MIRRLVALVLLSTLAVSASTSVRLTPSASQEPCSQNHEAWVSQTLKKIETIRPGMTRGELLKVFTTEGGLSTGLHRTFIGTVHISKLLSTLRRSVDQTATRTGGWLSRKTLETSSSMSRGRICNSLLLIKRLETIVGC